jgi:hypothetical protein
MKQVTIIIVNYDEVARYGDERIWQHVLQTCQLSRKCLIPKSLKFDGYRVSRSDHETVVHLYYGEKEKFRFGFAAVPDFSRL